MEFNRRQPVRGAEGGGMSKLSKQAKLEIMEQALRSILEVERPQQCLDGNAKMGDPHAVDWNFAMIARRALRAVAP